MTKQFEIGDKVYWWSRNRGMFECGHIVKPTSADMGRVYGALRDRSIVTHTVARPDPDDVRMVGVPAFVGIVGSPGFLSNPCLFQIYGTLEECKRNALREIEEAHVEACADRIESDDKTI